MNAGWLVCGKGGQLKGAADGMAHRETVAGPAKQTDRLNGTAAASPHLHSRRNLLRAGPTLALAAADLLQAQRVVLRRRCAPSPQLASLRHTKRKQHIAASMMLCCLCLLPPGSAAANLHALRLPHRWLLSGRKLTPLWPTSTHSRDKEYTAAGGDAR